MLHSTPIPAIYNSTVLNRFIRAETQTRRTLYTMHIITHYEGSRNFGPETFGATFWKHLQRDFSKLRIITYYRFAKLLPKV